MNKKASSGPSMTWLVFGLAAFIMITVLSTSIYTDVMDKNGGSVDTTYSSTYANIAGYENNLSSLNKQLTDDTSIWMKVSTGLGATFNALVIGVGAVGTFMSLVSLVPVMFNEISSALYIPSIVVWFITIVIMIYIVTRVYKAYRGHGEEA